MDAPAEGIHPDPAELLGDGAQRAARRVAIDLQARVRATHARLDDADDAHALHDFRVAVRRLRSWLGIDVVLPARLAPKGVLKRLRKVAKASNASRDRDVFGKWLGGKRDSLPEDQREAADWLLASFAASAAAPEAGTCAGLERDFGRAMERLDECLPWYQALHHVDRGAREPAFSASLAALLRLDADRLQRRLAAVEDRDDGRSIHRARVAGKRLRYHLEPVAGAVPGAPGCVDGLKRLQDLLGDFTDGVAWIDIVRTIGKDAPDGAIRHGLDGIAARVRKRGAHRFKDIEEQWLTGEPVLFVELAEIIGWLDAREPAIAEA